jgi:gas vesicle protein
MTDFERFGEYENRGQCQGGHTGIALTFLLVGLGVGAVTALLLAPKTGRQMRKLLRRGFEDAKEQLGDLQDQAGDWVERGSKWAKQARSRVAPMARKFAE